MPPIVYIARMQRAFTLVELSIVLVILGLLTGGILAGQSLIRAAGLRSVSADVARYTASIRSFQDKYLSLPGDMRNAVKYWGAQAGGTADGANATCAALDRNNPATSAATCNGDGNGQIGGYFNLSFDTAYESHRAWQHLANAGLVEGSYTGVTNSTINDYMSGPVGTAGLNQPASKLRPAGYSLAYWGSHPAGSFYVTGLTLIQGEYGHVMVLGTPGGYHNMGTGPILRGEEAWNIDTKMDDGLPLKGAMFTTPNAWYSTSCPIADNSAYNLTVSTNQCMLTLELGM